MRKEIAKKNLSCVQCDKVILKGMVYFKKRIVYNDTFEINYCPKCKYKQEQSLKRLKNISPMRRYDLEFLGYI